MPGLGLSSRVKAVDSVGVSGECRNRVEGCLSERGRPQGSHEKRRGRKRE